jgi:hypothetical protein
VFEVGKLLELWTGYAGEKYDDVFSLRSFRGPPVVNRDSHAIFEMTEICVYTEGKLNRK